jgi:hypothetical protein
MSLTIAGREDFLRPRRKTFIRSLLYTVVFDPGRGGSNDIVSSASSFRHGESISFSFPGIKKYNATIELYDRQYIRPSKKLTSTSRYPYMTSGVRHRDSGDRAVTFRSRVNDDRVPPAQ